MLRLFYQHNMELFVHEHQYTVKCCDDKSIIEYIIDAILNKKWLQMMIMIIVNMFWQRIVSY